MPFDRVTEAQVGLVRLRSEAADRNPEMGQSQQEDGEEVTQGRDVHVERQVSERPKLAAQVFRGHGHGLGIVGDGGNDDRCVRIVDPGDGRRGGVQHVLLEEDQSALDLGEVAPLMHLPRAHPQPGSRPQGVAVEVDDMPEVALSEHEQMMEVGALGPGEGLLADALP